jgi:hypothetical protein
MGDNAIFDSMYLFFWHDRVQFLTINLRVGFSQEKGNNIGVLSLLFLT